MLTAQTRLTLPAATPGTPEYMSPEQARGDSELDQRTDLYSAGVTAGSYIPDGQTERVRPESSEPAEISRIRLIQRTGREAEPWMKAHIERQAPYSGAILTVDRNLNLLDVEPNTGAMIGLTEDYWCARWKPIIQNGEYVDQ